MVRASSSCSDRSILQSQDTNPRLYVTQQKKTGVDFKLQQGPARITAFPFQAGPIFSYSGLYPSIGDLLVAGKVERAGAGLAVGGGAVAGVAIKARQAGLTVRTRGVVEALLEERKMGKTRAKI